MSHTQTAEILRAYAMCLDQGTPPDVVAAMLRHTARAIEDTHGVVIRTRRPQAREEEFCEVGDIPA